MDDFKPMRDEYPVPEEFPAPGPEFTPVGLRTAAAAQENAKRKKKKRLIYAIAAAALVLAVLGPFRLFDGGRGRAPVVPDAPQPGAQQQGQPSGPSGGGAATAQPSASPSTSAEPTAEPTEAPAVVPECDIYLTSFYSEVRAKLEFRGMDDAETVTLELWDPETESCDATWDITEPALEDGAYCPPPFTTDLIYEKHSDYYDAKNDFPMRCRLKALITYRDGAEEKTAEFSADSVESPGWHVEYLPLDTTSYGSWINPGCFQVQVKDAPAEWFISLSKDMPESENYLSVSMEIDGKSVRIDPAKLKKLHDEYDVRMYVPGEEDLVDKHVHTSLLVIPMPDGYAEGGGHTATFTVRQYLPAYETAVVFTQDVEF